MMTDLHSHHFVIPLEVLLTPLVSIGSRNAQSTSDVRDSCHVFNTLVASENLVHLLDSEAFGFGDAEVYPDDEDEAEDEEEVEGAESDGLEHSRGDKCDDEIREPVRRDCNTNSLGPYSWREHLRRHNPVDTSSILNAKFAMKNQTKTAAAQPALLCVSQLCW